MSKKTIDIIGVPTDLGANLRGANMGPAALRIAGLKDKIEALGYPVIDSGDVLIPVRETINDQSSKLRYLKEVTKTSLSVFESTRSSLQKGRIPIVIGGDHSSAIGSLAAVSDFFNSQNRDFGVIWIDAHADLNTAETSPSGNIHGMPLAVALGYGHKDLLAIGGAGKNGMKVNPKKVALIGIRTLDPKEKEILKDCGIRYFTMREIDERGMFAVMKEAIEIAGKDTAGIHLSLDLDGVDPDYAPGVSTAVTGGLSLREAHLAMETLADQNKLCSVDLVELNPIHDEKHRTAYLAVELMESALGKSIV